MIDSNSFLKTYQFHDECVCYPILQQHCTKWRMRSSKCYIECSKRPTPTFHRDTDLECLDTRLHSSIVRAHHIFFSSLGIGSSHLHSLTKSAICMSGFPIKILFFRAYQFFCLCGNLVGRSMSSQKLDIPTFFRCSCTWIMDFWSNNEMQSKWKL